MNTNAQIDPGAAKGAIAPLAVKVPEVTALFWALKLLSTGTGEATSDFLGSVSVPLAGAIGIFGFLVALRLQLRSPRYSSARYWGLVMMVAIFGTMVADALHDAGNLSYTTTTFGFALIVAAIFALWYRSEGTLSIHEINTRRREYFYWSAVFGTFALGTAAGDWTATSLNLGFSGSIALFAAIIAIPLVGWARFSMNPIFAFWFAYVMTRPLGASIADWLSKPTATGGVALGNGPVAFAGIAAFAALVAYAAASGRDRRKVPLHLPHLHGDAVNGPLAQSADA
ncbi:MAG TPA: hypothetical protein VMA83_09550 [Solirubrobacteraceae bacterium]|nr:hypothetical protein [Solirubrobacteraceae bacterium]